MSTLEMRAAIEAKEQDMQRWSWCMKNAMLAAIYFEKAVVNAESEADIPALVREGIDRARIDR